MAMTVHPDSVQQGVPEKVKEAQKENTKDEKERDRLKNRKLSFNTSEWSKLGVELDGTFYPYNFNIPAKLYFEFSHISDDNLPSETRADLMEQAYALCFTADKELKDKIPPAVRSDIVLDWFIKSSNLNEEEADSGPLGKTG